MPEPLPPDLSRLGDALSHATARSAVAERRRTTVRRRLALTGIGTALAFAILAPGTLQPGNGASTLQAAAATTVAYKPNTCDQPRGATFAAARPCASPGTTDVALNRLARRYAEN